MSSADRLVAAGLVLGEGPIALDGDRFACVDIRRGLVLEGGLDGSLEVVARRDGTVSALGRLDDGRLVAAVENRLEVLSDPGLVVDLPIGDGSLRTNDGKADPVGRFVVGTMADPPAPGAGSLWSISDGTPRRILDQVTISNGLCWSADGGTMFFIDTPTREVVAFDYDAATGTITDRRLVATVEEGLGDPDGMTIDADGRLWVAMWGGGAVLCFDGHRVVERIDVSTPFVTCPTFVGPELDRLVITTASEPVGSGAGAGDIYLAHPGVTGLSSNTTSCQTLFGQR